MLLYKCTEFVINISKLKNRGIVWIKFRLQRFLSTEQKIHFDTQEYQKQVIDSFQCRVNVPV